MDETAFAAAVIRDAKSACSSFRSGGTVNDQSVRTGLGLTDDVAIVAFLVEAATFYCPQHLIATNDGTYSTPVFVTQDENCPTSERDLIVASTFDPIHHNFELSVTNKSAFDAIVHVEKRPHGHIVGWAHIWSDLDDVVDILDPVVKAGGTISDVQTNNPYDLFTIDRWDFRLKPHGQLFLGCGYQPGYHD